MKQQSIGLLFGMLVGCGDGGVGGAGGTDGAGDSGATTASVTSAATKATSTSPSSSSVNTSTNASSSTGAMATSVSLDVTPTMVAAGESVQGTVTVTNFELEPPNGQPNQPGVGHFHIYLDDASGTDYLVAGQTAQVMIRIPVGTPAGPHTLRISLGENNHKPLNPPVDDVVDIVVQ